MSNYVTADNGVQLDIVSLAQTFEYDNGFVSTITVEYSGKTYVQTFTNDGTNITEISEWEVQP